MCYNSVPPKSDYNFHGATLLSAYLWSRLTSAKVVVSVAYLLDNTSKERLEEFAKQLIKIGAIVRLVPVQEGAVCDCVSQALWLRNLAYIMEEISEDDLMMISESDVFIASERILDPLYSSHRAWLYWIEPALHGGQTFAMSFTTMTKRDWRMILQNTSTCEAALEMFEKDVSVKTLDDWGVNNGKHWESDQNIVTAQLLRAKICSVPQQNRLNNLFLKNTSVTPGFCDSATCWKGQGFGECRAYKFGNTWYSTIGGCSWWHHTYPITLFTTIVEHNKDQWVYPLFIWTMNKEEMFFNPDRPYLPGPGYKVLD